MRCTTDFFLHVVDRAAHLPADCHSQITIRQKRRLSKDRHAYIFALVAIYISRLWMSQFTLHTLNVPLCQMQNTKWWIKTFHIFILTLSFGLFDYMTALLCCLYICNTSGCPGGLQDHSPLLKVKPVPCLDRLDIASPKNYLILHLPRKSRWRPKR